MKPLYVISLITFAFGALAFAVLVLMYLRQRTARSGGPLAAFTAVCGAAFVINLALQIVSARQIDSPLVSALALILAVTTSLLPPLVFHIVYAKERAHLPSRRLWGFALLALYAAFLAAAVLTGPDSPEWLNDVPAASLGISAALAIAAQIVSSRAMDTAALHQRRWNQALFALMAAAAALNLAISSPWASLLPDYLLLAFFCVTLYYEERLIFFDLLIKRGAFFAAALVILPAVVTAGSALAGSTVDWTRSAVCAILLAPFWLIAPWVYRRIEGAIDRRWLKRRYSIPEAEQKFVRDAQAATGQEDLVSRVAASLSEIFQAPAFVSFDPESSSAKEALAVPIKDNAGWISIEARPDGMPFLSDDRRLLHSLAQTLGVVAENVRFREREHHLRSLASRAELKALRAQMNPHFLFNALNAIAGLIEDQPKLADATIEQLAHVLRYALRHSENEWVRLDEEVEFLRAYLQVEQARFGERLRVEVGVARDAAMVPIPAMTIQPLVENAIKHGVSLLTGEGRISVKASIDDEHLSVEVSDNGPGFPAGFSMSAAGHGLRNIAERIEGYYGDCANLSWTSGPDGTRVVLRIPRGAVPEVADKHGDACFSRG